MTANESSSEQTERLSLSWLVAGALAGLAMAAWGLLEQGPYSGLPPGAVARIDDTVISRDRFDREVARLESAAGRATTADEKGRLLEQLVREELLLMRGIELGLVESDSTVRNAIAQSLVASVTADADAADPPDDELQRYLEENAERYTYASAMELDAWTADDEAVARDFLRRLEADPSAMPGPAVARVAGLPAGPAPIERLRMFVGPAIAAAAADMPVAASAIFARQGRWYVVRVRSREQGTVADLAGIRSQVLIDYRRDLAAERLDDYVDDLRRRADVVIELPQ